MRVRVHALPRAALTSLLAPVHAQLNLFLAVLKTKFAKAKNLLDEKRRMRRAMRAGRGGGKKQNVLARASGWVKGERALQLCAALQCAWHVDNVLHTHTHSLTLAAADCLRTAGRVASYVSARAGKDLLTSHISDVVAKKAASEAEFFTPRSDLTGFTGAGGGCCAALPHKQMTATAANLLPA
jgi:hypothetical protein